MLGTDPGARLLRTGEAALILGCSRQHVVDLCDSGRLPSIRVGKHRRVAWADLERLAGAEEPLTRDESQSLWLHVAVAGELVRDPDDVMSKARANAARALARDPPAGASRTLRRWVTALDAGPDAVLRMLIEPGPEGREWRHVSPFASILGERQRQAIIRSFRKAWLEGRR
jgi:excisionase family DNA binding protein